MKSDSKRLFYLDVLRVIACLCVIMIHASSQYVSNNYDNFNFFIGNIFDSFVRIGVPLFVMISGALLLDEKYEYSKEKNIKHIKKMLIFFVFWSILYCMIFRIIPAAIKHEPIYLFDIIKSIIFGHYHLWFIYLIIGLYLIVPLLRLWVKDKNKKYVEYFIILSIIFTIIIPQIFSIGSIFSNIFVINNSMIAKLNFNYVGGFTTYFLLGWYINNYEIKNKKIIYILGIFALLITMFGNYYLHSLTNETELLYDNLSINVLIQTVAVFIFTKNIFKKSNRENKYINSISKYSLGIYAIHAMYCELIYNILFKFKINFALINIPIVFILVFILSYLSVYILSKIPFLNKVLQ